MNIIIGIGEYAISNSLEDSISTYALASCIGITFYSYRKKVAGMIHIALPKGPYERMEEKPGYYAESGIIMILQEMQKKFGCRPHELEVKIYGAAKSVRKADVFKVGENNIIEVKKILFKEGLFIEYENIGGHISRSIELKVSTGEVLLMTQPLYI